MPTLQELRKAKYRTIKAFAEAYGCSPSKASGILHGNYHMALSKDDVKYLAHILGVSFLACAEACDDTYALFKGYKGDAWKKTARTHKGIWARWQWEEEIQGTARKAAESGDWTEFRKKYANNDWYEEQRRTYRDPVDRLFGPLLHKEIFDTLGIPMNASEAQIIQAFRNKVKLASDGKGGYKGDMDKLVHAKEEALKIVRKQ